MNFVPSPSGSSFALEVSEGSGTYTFSGGNTYYKGTLGFVKTMDLRDSTAYSGINTQTSTISWVNGYSTYSVDYSYSLSREYSIRGNNINKVIESESDSGAGSYTQDGKGTQPGGGCAVPPSRVRPFTNPMAYLDLFSGGDATHATDNSNNILMIGTYLDMQNTSHPFSILSNGNFSSVIGTSNVNQYYTLGPK